MQDSAVNPVWTLLFLWVLKLLAQGLVAGLGFWLAAHIAGRGLGARFRRGWEDWELVGVRRLPHGPVRPGLRGSDFPVRLEPEREDLPDITEQVKGEQP
jgi:hypothetical protein